MLWIEPPKIFHDPSKRPKWTLNTSNFGFLKYYQNKSSSIFDDPLSTPIFFCNKEDTIQYHGSLRSRELGQASMLLVLLTPIQVLSSHLCAFIMILWESMNFHPDWQLFQVAGAVDRTADPWVTGPTLPHTPRGTPYSHLNEAAVAWIRSQSRIPWLLCSL